MTPAGPATPGGPSRPDQSLGNGRYTLDARIAAGGMGEVWRGTDTSLGRPVAIKVLRANVADDESFRVRFAAEAKHAASLHDSRIATVFDYGDDLDAATGRHTTYLVMELVEGRPLSDLISRPIAPDQAALLVAQAAEGLAVAHEAGIVHRDVKPANFLVTPDGKLKITDFGIARARGAASITDTGLIMGTPHYVAPEVAEGREATPASDLYSLGVVLYEALSGSKPFQGETPVAIALAHLRDEPIPLPGSVPPRLRAIVESTMARDPAQRPPDARALAGELRRFASGPGGQATTAMAAPPPVAATQVMPAAAPAPATVAAAATGGPPPEQSDRRRAGWLPIAVAVLAVLLIVGIAYAATRGDDESPTPAAGTRAEPTTSAPSTTEPTTPTTTAPTTTSPTTTTVTIDPAAYVGRPVKDVEKDLKDLGLEPVRGDEVPGGEKDTVADISPTGEVPEGTQVTLAVYTGDEGDASDNSDENGHGPKPPKPKEN